MIKVNFTRPYLIHSDGRVVWAQASAYQDTPGLAMWCDLVMKPARLNSGRPRWALIWDNNRSHTIKSVLDVFEEAGISVFCLPVNMTDILQPVDLVPNGPLKSHMRSARVDALYNYFQAWRELAETAESKHQRLPVFDPPPPTMGQGIAIISDIYSRYFTTADYMAGARRCFVSVGLARDTDGQYVTYVSHQRGKTRAKSFRGIKHKKTDLEGATLFQDFAFDEAFGQGDEGYVAAEAGPTAAEAGPDRESVI